MKILPLITNLNIQNQNCVPQVKRHITSSFVPLKTDTVSFGAMRKKQFDGIDFAVVEKFKAPIEKFNSNEDLQDWAEIQAMEIGNKDFGGRQRETRIHRKEGLKEWLDYVLYENDAYNNATALLILNAITKDLKDNNDKLPPILNKGVLADCISEIDKNLKADRKYQFDLNKMYESKLKEFYLEESGNGEPETKWVVIPSKSHDPENFSQNVEKLKSLSHKDWCTKSFNAEPYLRDGDFHVYLENGQPKLGLRFVGDKIQEIQGELNNSKIPVSYLDEVKDYIAENKLELTSKVDSEIVDAEKNKALIAKAKLDLKDSIANNDVKKIFEYFDFDVEEDENGFLTLEKYGQPSGNFTFKDCGIDEDKLFQKVKNIKTDVNFKKSQVTNLGKLESIGGSVNFEKSQVINLGELRSIGGSVIFSNSKITDLSKLKEIGGFAHFGYSQVTDLGELELIGGSANFAVSQVTDLGKLKRIGLVAYFIDCPLKNLGCLESIGVDAYISNSKLSPEDFDNIEIGGEIK